MTKLGKQILSLRKDGKSYNDIVSILGCSKGTVSYYCGIGQKSAAYKRNKIKANKLRTFITEYKKKIARCSDCGENYPPWILEFDHVSGEKKFNISHIKCISSMDTLLEEIAKCEVVCANCHRTRTFNRQLGNSRNTSIAQK